MKLRVGRHAPRNLWLQRGPHPAADDLDVGRIDSPQLAAMLVVAFNRTYGPLLSGRPDWPSGDDVLAEVTEFLDQPDATDGDDQQGATA